MNLKIKLGLLFGSLAVLLIVSAALSYLLVKRIDNDVQNLGRVVDPLIETAFVTEIKSMIRYTIDGDETQLRSNMETRIDIVRALDNYTRMAKTEKEREAVVRLGQIFMGLRGVREDFFGVNSDIRTSLAGLSLDVAKIEEIIDEQLEVPIDRNSPDGLVKWESLLNMATNLDDGLFAVQSYIDDPSPRIRQVKRAQDEEFKESEAVFRSSHNSSEEEDMLAVIDEVFVDTMTMGDRVMDKVDERRNLLVRVVDDLEKIDRIVEEDVRPLILAVTADRLNSAESSVDVATLSALVLVALGTVVGVGAVAIVARHIVNPITRLTNAAVELGKGNLGVRADVETRDEIGSLATSFNQMAAARQQAEDQRVELISELAAQNAELAKLDELKDNFLSSVSHALRTPLTAIKGSAEILLDEKGVTTETQRQFLTIINSECDRLTRLINDVLDLARYESGQAQWNDELHSIRIIVESAVSGIQSLAIQNNLKVNVSLDPDLSEVWCDQDKINQVLTNLLSNAIKITRDRGEIGVFAKTTFAAGSKGDGRFVEIRVSDNGAGIATEHLDEIFQKYKQLGNTPSDAHQGTGLGLPICKEIVDHYGGSIWVESELGTGSVFIFTLPLTP